MVFLPVEVAIGLAQILRGLVRWCLFIPPEDSRGQLMITLDSGAVKAMPMFGLVFAASESRVGREGI